MEFKRLLCLIHIDNARMPPLDPSVPSYPHSIVYLCGCRLCVNKYYLFTRNPIPPLITKCVCVNHSLGILMHFLAFLSFSTFYRFSRTHALLTYRVARIRCPNNTIVKEALFCQLLHLLLRLLSTHPSDVDL